MKVNGKKIKNKDMELINDSMGLIMRTIIFLGNKVSENMFGLMEIDMKEEEKFDDRKGIYK